MKKLTFNIKTILLSIILLSGFLTFPERFNNSESLTNYFIESTCRSIRFISTIDLRAYLPYRNTFSPINEWRQAFDEIATEYPYLVEEVIIGLNRGDKGSFCYTLKIPKKNSLTEISQYELVVDYLLSSILFTLAWWGAHEVLISSNGELFQILDERFRSLPLSNMANFLRSVYKKDLAGGEFKLIKATPIEITNLKMADLSIDTLALSLGTGLAAGYVVESDTEYDITLGDVVGVDVGGSDIKVVYKKEEEIVFQKEHNWSPMSIKDDSHFQHRDYITNLVNLARLKVAIDELGNSDPDIIKLYEDVTRVETDPEIKIEKIADLIARAQDLGIKLAGLDSLEKNSGTLLATYLNIKCYE